MLRVNKKMPRKESKKGKEIFYFLEMDIAGSDKVFLRG